MFCRLGRVELVGELVGYGFSGGRARGKYSRFA